MVVVTAAFIGAAATSRAQTTPPLPCDSPVVDFLGCPRDPTQQARFAQLYRLGTFNMAGGNKGHGDNAETAVALAKSITGRGIDFLFLQETCQRMTDRLQEDLAPKGYKVEFIPTESKCIRRTPRKHRRDRRDRKGSPYGIGIVYRSFRSVFTRKPRVYSLPSELVRRGEIKRLERRKMVCLKVFYPRRIVACSTHLTANSGRDRDKNRLEQTEKIAAILAAEAADGWAILLGGDFNMKPENPSLDPLWDPLYGGAAHGDFLEVDSGPSTEKDDYHRDGGETTHGGIFGKKKIDYIFVHGVAVLNADVGRSKFSDHRPLWAEVLSPAQQPN
ncbi:endonuclease/exonuclease/phosphatase family protein [Gaiella sp.]|uniref:endonuclease/exonuclease/phosphatase family protein n=1 Tax=Gaiella sp. TaxID=2663207 RepID=UPI0039838A48